jgi:hypothetical protein
MNHVKAGLYVFISRNKNSIIQFIAQHRDKQVALNSPSFVTDLGTCLLRQLDHPSPKENEFRSVTDRFFN